MDLEDLKEWVDAPKTGILNARRMQEVVDAYEIIKEIILPEDPDATVEIAEGALQFGSVVIKVTTNDVTVYDTAKFAAATKHASNFQVYPTTDDRVKMDILFSNVIEYTAT